MPRLRHYAVIYKSIVTCNCVCITGRCCCSVLTLVLENVFSVHVGKGLGRDSKKEIERERERQNSKRKQMVGIKDKKEGVKGRY